LADAVASHNNTLRKLHLHKNNIGNEGARFLAEALLRRTSTTTATSSLEKLYLGDNHIGADGARCLADALRSPNSALRHLYLHHNAVGDQGAAYLADALRSNAVLLTLDLTDNHVGAGGARALLDALSCHGTALQSLSLGGNNDIPNDILQQFKAALRLPVE
jgi:Ran GTPase-activating protein (RanGAP) involved in mRNA processing and transport